MRLEVQQSMPMPMLILSSMKIGVSSSTLDIRTMEEAQAEEAHMEAICPNETFLGRRMTPERNI